MKMFTVRGETEIIGMASVYEQQLNYSKKVELGFRELKCPEPGATVCLTDTGVCRDCDL